MAEISPLELGTSLMYLDALRGKQHRLAGELDYRERGIIATETALALELLMEEQKRLASPKSPRTRDLRVEHEEQIALLRRHVEDAKKALAYVESEIEEARAEMNHWLLHS